MLLAEEGRWDLITPISLLVLCTMSVLFIHSAQAYVGGIQWKMQIIWCVIGFSFYIGVSVLDYHFWMKFAHVFTYWPSWLYVWFFWARTLRGPSLDRFRFIQDPALGGGQMGRYGFGSEYSCPFPHWGLA